jgi:C1A family cysteine protease
MLFGRDRKSVFLYVLLMGAMIWATGAWAQDSESHGKGFWLPEILKDVRPGDGGVKPAMGTRAASDSTFDWVALGQMTPVKNQGTTNTCWAFAGCGLFESRSIIQESPSITPDMSEQDLGNYYANGYVNGGNGLMDAAYWARYGTVDESVEPWTGSLGTWDSTNTKVKRLNSFAFLGNLAATSSGDTSSVTTIKQALTHGPVYTSMCTTVCDSWNAAWGTKVIPYTVYVSNPVSANDHAVVIVGWDDTKTQEGTTTTGAWKVRNSWGTSWGVSGYFWVGYGAAGLGYGTGYIPSGTGGTIGTLPALGDEAYEDWTDQIVVTGNDNGYGGSGYGYGSGTTNVYAVNKMTVPSDLPSGTNQMLAVDLPVLYENTSYEIRFYRSFTTGSGGSLQAGASQTGSFTHAGYWSVDLTTPFDVTAGETIYLWVRYTRSAGTNMYMPTSYSNPGLSNTSYLSWDNSTWDNMDSTGSDTDFAFRIRVGIAVHVDRAGTWELYE